MKYIAVLIIFFLGFIFFFWPEKNVIQNENAKFIEDLQKENLIKVEEPRWKKWNRIYEASDPDLGVVLGDLESHLKKGHSYRDDNKITWAHQVTHGINAVIRNENMIKEGCNGFYVLQDRAIILKEPFITINDVAREIPNKLRGPSFNLYLIEQNDKWNDRPLYLMDEWIAFTTGSEVGKDLNFESSNNAQEYNFDVSMAQAATIAREEATKIIKSKVKEAKEKVKQAKEAVGAGAGAGAAVAVSVEIDELEDLLKGLKM